MINQSEHQKQHDIPTHHQQPPQEPPQKPPQKPPQQPPQQSPQQTSTFPQTSITPQQLLNIE